MARARIEALLLTASLVGCSSGEPSEQRSSEPLTVPQAAQPSSALSAAEPAEPTVLEIDVSGADPDGETVTISPVAVEPRALTWAERASFDEALAFVFVTGGALARSPSGYRELDESGALVLNPDLELPAGQLLGYWPSSAWHIEVEAEPADPDSDEPRFSYQMSTFERGKWKVIKRRGARRWHDGEVQFRKGWHGGLLLRKGTNISRIGSKRAKPRAGARKGKEIVDMFETRAGRLYTITARDGGLHVQANCGDLACVEANARLLPRGASWRFSMHTPRLSNEASMVASVREAEGESHYLLSHDRRGREHSWVLEPLPEAPTGMWPDEQGGLWVLVGGKLWHRAHGALWTDIELPGAGGLSAAMVGEPPELWLAVSTADGAKIYATPGTPD